MRRRLFDTDILIEYLRGRPRAVEYLEGLKGDLCLSTVTVAELYAGVKGEDEQQALAQFLQAFRVIPLSESAARDGGLLRRDFGPSHGTDLPDALLAATAQELEATLITFNQRHFPMLEDLEVPYRRE